MNGGKLGWLQSEEKKQQHRSNIDVVHNQEIRCQKLMSQNNKSGFQRPV